MYKLTPILWSLGACKPSIRWLHEHNFPTARQAWEEISNIEWLLWVATHVLSRAQVARALYKLGNQYKSARGSDPTNNEAWREISAVLRGHGSVEKLRTFWPRHNAQYPYPQDASEATFRRFLEYLSALITERTHKYASVYAYHAVRALYDLDSLNTLGERRPEDCRDYAPYLKFLRKHLPYESIEAGLIQYGREHKCLKIDTTAPVEVEAPPVDVRIIIALDVSGAKTAADAYRTVYELMNAATRSRTDVEWESTDEWYVDGNELAEEEVAQARLRILTASHTP